MDADFAQSHDDYVAIALIHLDAEETELQMDARKAAIEEPDMVEWYEDEISELRKMIDAIQSMRAENKRLRERKH